MHAAIATESGTAQGMASYQVACALHDDNEVDAAERVTVSSAEDLVVSQNRASFASKNIRRRNAVFLAGVIAARRSDRQSRSGASTALH